MRDRPDGADLLAIARKVLREDLIEALPAERRYEALMAANAMAIAARQLAAGEGLERDELNRLAKLLGESAPADAGNRDAVRNSLSAFYARLCSAIRRGQLDPGTPDHAEAHAFLVDVARAKVAESNPRYLESKTASAGS